MLIFSTFLTVFYNLHRKKSYKIEIIQKGELLDEMSL